jgi:hypothetical protein
MAVYVNNITLNTGEYFSRDFYLDNINGTPLNLSGYTAASQMRKHPESVNATADFNVGFIDRTNGRIRVSLATKKTRLVKPGRYVWDVMFSESNPSGNSSVWTTLEANNYGSYRGYTNSSWSTFMNTYAYSRVPQSGNLSDDSDPYGVKQDSYQVFFPYDGVYQIDAAADNVGSVTINGTSFNAAALNATNVGVGTISLNRGDHTVALSQQNADNGLGSFDDNPVGLAVSITYVGGTGYGKKSIVIEGNVLATPDITPSCIITVYDNEEVGIIEETGGAASGVSIDNISTYGVIHIGVNFNQCSTFDIGSSSTRDMLEDATQRQKLIDYMNIGGVVWLNVEWWNGSTDERSCSDRSNINAMLTLLGTEIRAIDDDPIQGSTRSTETSVINSNFPATQSQNASVIFSGGTPVFVDGTNTITTYEKIGQGILYVSGDTNTFNGPSYPENYYNALRALVLNS